MNTLNEQSGYCEEIEQCPLCLEFVDIEYFTSVGDEPSVCENCLENGYAYSGTI